MIATAEERYQLIVLHQERFWGKVDRSGDCWEWGGGVDKDGYGQISLSLPRDGRAAKQVKLRSHRCALALSLGAWPSDDLVTLHACDNPSCCNPAHLSLGTQKENRVDCAKKNRTAKGDRSGRHTHPEKVRRGEAHPLSRITQEQATQIVTRRGRGETVSRIAREMGVSLHIAYQVASGRTWRHAAQGAQP